MNKEFHTKLAGVTKKNDEEESIQKILKSVADYCHDGWELELEHEADNPWDQNAIKVFLDGDHIGYIKRELAEELAPLVDQNRVEATLSEITGGEDGKSYGCNILISILPEGEAARSSIPSAGVSYVNDFDNLNGRSPHTCPEAYRVRATRNPEPQEPTLFDILVPKDSIREKIFLAGCGLLSFTATISLLYIIFA